MPAQGLLHKNPKLRLSWPDLLKHPFVRTTPAEEEARAAVADQERAATTETRGWRGERALEADGAAAPLIACLDPLMPSSI